MDFIFKKYDEKTSTILAKNVFVTGAAAKLPGLKERLESDLISLRPFKSETNVDIASNPSIDAYRGMQTFSRNFRMANKTNNLLVHIQSKQPKLF